MKQCIVILLLLCSCGPRSPEDTRSRGENLTRKLIKECRQIHTRRDLQEHLPKLRVLYEAIADLLVRAEKNLGTQQLSPRDIDQKLNEELRAELIRIYQIEGARELIEKAQQGALTKIALWDERRSQKLS